jgi:hypothetical protein
MGGGAEAVGEGATGKADHRGKAILERGELCRSVFLRGNSGASAIL